MSASDPLFTIHWSGLKRSSHKKPRENNKMKGSDASGVPKHEMAFCPRSLLLQMVLAYSGQWAYEGTCWLSQLYPPNHICRNPMWTTLKGPCASWYGRAHRLKTFSFFQANQKKVKVHFGVAGLSRSQHFWEKASSQMPVRASRTTLFPKKSEFTRRLPY